MLRLRLLDSFELRNDDDALTGLPKRVQAIVAYLVLQRGRAAARDRVASLIWPDRAIEQARQSLRQGLLVLRSTLGPRERERVAATPAGLAFDLRGLEVDVLQFETLARSRNLTDLEAAAALYGGALLADVSLPSEPFEDWLDMERRQLHAMAADVLLALAQGHAAAGRTDAALAAGRRLAALDPLREEAHRLLMQLHSAAGQRTLALRQFALCTQILERELGVAPESETVQLARTIEQSDARATVRRMSVPGDVALHNLPAQPTALIGRGAEIARIEKTLPDHRLLTLTGEGGIGKTRLALEIGTRALASYRDGVWLVDLAPLSDPDLVPSAVATALGVDIGGSGDPCAVLARRVRSSELLIVLDNCEHVIAAAAHLAETLLGGAAKVRVLATSREPLDVAGEEVFRLRLLSLPPEGTSRAEDVLASDAVQLFVERARSDGAGFMLDDRNAAAAAEICRRLDGIPLALELVASRVPALGIDVLADRLAARFSVLTFGRRGGDPRHRTLQATLDWSYGLLSEADQTVLRCLAIFAGGCTLEAAEAVVQEAGITAIAVVGHLASLVAKSLLRLDAAEDQVRYRLLEITRAHVLEKLEEGEKQDLQRRHAAFFCALMSRADAEHDILPSASWTRRYVLEIDNVRAALDWAFGQNGDAAIAAALAGSSNWLWRRLGLLAEGRRRIEHALGRIGVAAAPSVVARLHMAHAFLAFVSPHAAIAAADRAIALYRELNDPRRLGWSLVQRAQPLIWLKRFEEAHGTLAEAREILEAEGPSKALVVCIGRQGLLAQSRGADLDAAHALHERAISLARALGDEANEHLAAVNLSELLLWRGAIDEAIALARHTVIGLRRNRDTVNLGWALAKLGAALLGRNDLGSARAALSEAFELLRIRGDAYWVFNHVGLLVAREGALEDAARLSGYAERAYERLGQVRQLGEERTHAHLLAELAQAITPEPLARLRSEGAVLTEDEVAALAFGRPRQRLVQVVR
jgi:predicted ATPase/DNA-binding SARP family transcriptional activator